MSMESRHTFLKTLESKLSDTLTANQLNEVMNIASNVITDYIVDSNPDATPCGDGVDDLYEAYFTAMKIQGRSEKTLWRYDYILKRMFKHFSGVNSSNINVYHLRKYMQDEKERGIGDNTVNGYRMIFCAYFKWLHREGLIRVDPTANLGAIKCPKRMKKAYTDVELDQLHGKLRDPRDTAIVRTLEYTGCRISELTGMNIRDLNLEKMEIVVIGKGNKQRTVYFDEVTAMAIKRYLNTRNDSNPALFIGRYGDRLTPGGVRCMLRKVARKAKVSGVYPHKFRRTLATNLNKHGMSVQEIAHVLGHEDINTTMKYIAMDNTLVKHSYERYV